MVNSALVHIDLIISHLRNEVDLSDKLANFDKLYLTSVSVSELYAGTVAKDLPELKTFLENFVINPLDYELAVRSGALKQIFPKLKFSDVVFLAAVQQQGLEDKSVVCLCPRALKSSFQNFPAVKIEYL